MNIVNYWLKITFCSHPSFYFILNIIDTYHEKITIAINHRSLCILIMR